MVYILPSRKAIMLFLRKKKRANLVRDYKGRIQDNFERPERTVKRSCSHKKISIFILGIPLLCYCHLFLVSFDAKEGKREERNDIEVLVDDSALLDSLGLHIHTAKPHIVASSAPNQSRNMKGDDKAPWWRPCKVDFQNFTSLSSNSVTVNNSKIRVSLQNLYPMVSNGGYYKPKDCNAEDVVAIIVPYRNSSRQLTTFLYNIHPFLINQKIEYRIFVIEQYEAKKFNKGRLLNAGFKEAMKYGTWKCVIFHDVDLLPTSPLIRYTCPQHPRHMSSVVMDQGSQSNESSPLLFGGVTAMSVEHYIKVNGHSNMYWGWGGEDYDMFLRLRASGLPVVRYNKTIAKFFALSPVKEINNRERYRLLRNAAQRMSDDGLSTLTYEVVVVRTHHLHTLVTVAANDYNPGDCFKKKWLEINKHAQYVVVK